MVRVQEVGEEAHGAWGASQEVEGGDLDDIGDGGDLDDNNHLGDLDDVYDLDDPDCDGGDLDDPVDLNDLLNDHHVEGYDPGYLTSPHKGRVESPGSVLTGTCPRKGTRRI